MAHLLLASPHLHLSLHSMCRYIGFRPGDPTATPPPTAMPPPTVPPPPGSRTIDLRQMSMAELHAEAAATQIRDIFAALLPDPPGVLRRAVRIRMQRWPSPAGTTQAYRQARPPPPPAAPCTIAGVPPDRIAYVTGHEPTEQPQQQQPQQAEQQPLKQQQQQQPSKQPQPQQQPQQQRVGNTPGSGQKQHQGHKRQADGGGGKQAARRRDDAEDMGPAIA